MTPLSSQAIQFGRMHFSEIKPGKEVYTDKMPAPIKSHILHTGLRYSNDETALVDLIDVNLTVYSPRNLDGSGRHRAETFQIDEQGYVEGISELNPPKVVSKRGPLRKLLEFFGAPKTVLVNNTEK